MYGLVPDMDEANCPSLTNVAILKSVMCMCPFLKCSCDKSLKLPIFELDDQFICHTCYLSSNRQSDCQLVSFNSNIARLLAEENYLCEYTHCGKVVKGDYTSS
uniref:Uncharacterized protein n=1 Tax=Photinus pyralis TaxID=7054 RepID=A0A1Y1KSN0_PHOPY